MGYNGHVQNQTSDQSNESNHFSPDSNPREMLHIQNQIKICVEASEKI